MKKISIATIVILLILGISYFVWKGFGQNEEQKIEDVVNSELQSSFEEYNPMEVKQTIEITPTEDYEIGSFCRFYYDEGREEFFATFGTGKNSQGGANYIGGGEGGQGSAYAYYSSDLKETGETGYYIYGGGDLATNKIGTNLFHLSGGPSGWRLSKFDIASWEKVDEATIALDSSEGGNDEMLANVNGMLIASSAYGEEANGGDTSNVKKDPTVGIYTHHHLLDTSLALIDEWVLKDVLHANGSSMVYANEGYQFVTTTAYFGDLMVMQYDKDWKFLGSKTLIKDAQWPQGTVYDEGSEQYYVAYLATAMKSAEGVQARLAAFDKDWNLLSNTKISEYEKGYMAGRPSVMLHEGQLYVTFDKESMDESKKTPAKDWQCQLSVLEI